MACLKMADLDGDVAEGGRIPSYLLVQKQMQDLIAFQRTRVSKLEHSVSLQNTTLQESYIPREQHETELNRLQESIQADYVPKDLYEAVFTQLEQEKIQHARTKVELQDAARELDDALTQMEKLNLQVQEEKRAYEKAFGTLKSRTMQESVKSTKLKSQCSEFAKQCEKQEEILTSKTSEIETLEMKLKIQEELYKKELTEAEIEKRQQRYIAKMMEEQERKKTRDSSKGVPKTRTKRR